MNYYHNKEKADPANPGNRKEGSPKHINDPFYGTGSAAGNHLPEEKKKSADTNPPVHKDYDAARNSGGPHSSSIRPED